MHDNFPFKEFGIDGTIKRCNITENNNNKLSKSNSRKSF